MQVEPGKKKSKGRRALTLFSMAALISCSLLAFQNCGEGSFAVKALDSLGEAVTAVPLTPDTPSITTSSTGVPLNVTPASLTDKLVTSCLGDASFDACVFYKNPVAQDALPETTPWYTGDESRQRYGVKLRSLKSTGFLENNSFQVMGSGVAAGSGTRLTKSSSTGWRASVNQEASATGKGGLASQVSAYYWLNTYIELLETSPFIQKTYSDMKNVTVYPYTTSVDGQDWQNAAFFSGGTHGNSIIVGYGFNNSPLALSGEVMTHEFTHALVYHASNSTANASAATHKYCLQGVTGLSAAQVQSGPICCTSAIGCMRAINEGLADYFASVSFPSNPTVGEGLMNSTSGLTTCGAGTPRRDVRANAARTAASVYGLCKTQLNYGGTLVSVDMDGEQYTMASVYTSTLWEIRLKVKAAIPTITVGLEATDGGTLFDSIVHEHLMSLSGSSTFATSKLALKNAAAAVVATARVQLPTGVNLATLIDQEFARRGIN